MKSFHYVCALAMLAIIALACQLVVDCTRQLFVALSYQQHSIESPRHVKARPTNQITKSSMGKIKKRMTRQEVEFILGVPPGDHTSDRTKELCKLSSHAMGWPDGAQYWLGDQHGTVELIWIMFDEQGAVQTKGYDRQHFTLE